MLIIYCAVMHGERCTWRVYSTHPTMRAAGFGSVMPVSCALCDLHNMCQLAVHCGVNRSKQWSCQPVNVWSSTFVIDAALWYLSAVLYLVYLV
jgi:hypothetical protein